MPIVPATTRTGISPGLDYSEVNNEPSTVYAKRWVSREHLVPAFGKRRLDAIGPADVEAYKARKWKAFVTTALKTGLRVGELLALRWEDLDLFAGRRVVRRTLWHDQEGTPKGRRTRQVPLSDEAVAVLQAH